MRFFSPLSLLWWNIEDYFSNIKIVLPNERRIISSLCISAFPTVDLNLTGWGGGGE